MDRRQTKTGLLCLFQGLASVTMMMGNKRLALVFPFPFTTILVQNAICFVLCALLIPHQEGVSVGSKLRTLRARHLKACVPVGVATSLVLSSSIVALRFASVPLVVTFRNLTPLVVALLDHVVLGAVFNSSAKLGLVLGLCGSLLYTAYDPPRSEEEASLASSSSTTGSNAAGDEGSSRIQTTSTDSVLLQGRFGLLFVIANLVLSACVNILENTAMRELGGHGATTVNCLRIVVMTPVLLVFSALFEDQQQAWALLSGGFSSSLHIAPLFAATGTFAALFGVTALTLVSFVSPTTLAFLNVLYKLATTVVGHFLFPVAVPTLSWVGYTLTFCGFLSYTFGKIKKVGDEQTRESSDRKKNK
eukprot:g6872.t1